MTTVSNEILQEAHQKYLKVKELLEESENDPPTEPYRNKYKASELLLEIERGLSSAGDSFRISVLIAVINYELGAIAYETEDPSNCEKYLQKSWDLIKNDSQTPECVVLAVNVLNHLGILWSGRNELTKARDYLKAAEVSYGEYKLSKKPFPLSLVDLFKSPPLEVGESWAPLEKSLTLTLYYLAQVYEHLHENESSAKYCHITLKRQLESKDYDPLNWSLNCATLSQYFIAKDKFGAARHVLACASHIMSGYEAELGSQLENKDDEKWCTLNRIKADVSRCWAKYALHLLISSRDKLLDKSSLSQGIEELHVEDQSSDDFTKVYRLLKESEIKDIENQITCELVNNYEDARVIFLFGIKCLQESRNHYVLNDYTYDHVQIVQDNSKLYKFLTAFEESVERKCKMHKRRIDLLEGILQKLNPQYYLALCRQLMFELAETYSEIMDLKIQANANSRNLTPHAVKKVNFLVHKSIEHFNAFIDTLKDAKKELPETFSEDVVRPALVAYFCIGRLYSKIIVADPSKEVEYLRKSADHYSFVIKYVKKNPQHEPAIKEELAVMKEMVELLPSKIRKIVESSLS